MRNSFPQSLLDSEEELCVDDSNQSSEHEPATMYAMSSSTTGSPSSNTKAAKATSRGGPSARSSIHDRSNPPVSQEENAAPQQSAKWKVRTAAVLALSIILYVYFNFSSED